MSLSKGAAAPHFYLRITNIAFLSVVVERTTARTVSVLTILRVEHAQTVRQFSGTRKVKTSFCSTTLDYILLYVCMYVHACTAP